MAGPGRRIKKKIGLEAWRKGRMLRELGELAERPVTMGEAEIKLELKTGELKELINKDEEVRDIWRKKRLEIFLNIKDSLYESAKAGKMQAIKTIERLLTNEIGSLTSFDMHRITIKQMQQMTGKNRQTIYNWHTRYGLQRNSDGTFDLPVFIAWLENFSVKKNITNQNIDPLRQLKIERLKNDMEQEKGKLIERPVVMAGIITRHQKLLWSMSETRRKQLAAAVKNQPETAIDEILENFFSDILKEQLQLPESLRLTETQQQRFRQLLSELEN